MDRRKFLALSSAALAIAPKVTAGDDAPAGEPVAATVGETPSKWPAHTYRRFSVDMHVPDWSPELLAKFDPARYVELIAQGGFQSLLHYSNSHVGLALWNTKIGQRHANMGERDFLGEVVAECRGQNIHPLAYFSVIYDNWAFEHHEDWRRRNADGAVANGRYGLVCPNSPYRDYVFACVKEIAGAYDIAGMFFDMTFWPGVCYCRHCEARFEKEHGGPLPRIVNWEDPHWIALQQARERWLLDFATTCTSTARAARPGITVNHQFSSVFSSWPSGVPLELATACDYVGGDFYGGPTQHSLACKIFHTLSPSRPFEFHTSRTRSFTDHVTVKPLDELRLEASVATLHSAALMLVDYINVDGTLNAPVYDLLGKLNATLAPYEPWLGGDLLADVAIYYDKNSLYNPRENGLDVMKMPAPLEAPHRDAVVGMARVLQESHIPFGVVTAGTLDQLDRYQLLVLPNVLELTAGQADKIRAFVRKGGSLYASGPSSLDRRAAGGLTFLLEDLLGVRYVAQHETAAYLTPVDPDLAASITPQDHLALNGGLVLAEALHSEDVLARITLPFVDPALGTNIGSRFAAIHSNPPALKPEKNPAIVLRRLHGGTVAWVAAPIEAVNESVHKRLTENLLCRLLIRSRKWRLEAHSAVEMVLLDQPANKRLLAGLLNLQPNLPRVPVPARAHVRLPEGVQPSSVRALPAGQPTEFTFDAREVSWNIPPFDTLALYAVDYANA